ncbi:MAG TPA: amidohydrolase family protein [Acidimicrobiales bacterium]|nr:amidohydrolase family protein [Acidimicrobiales bacterium]
MAADSAQPDDRYLVISADCHGGAQLEEYRGYLERRYLEDFDGWAREYAVPFEDLKGENARRNWDHDRRLDELEADGIAAEVIFPNTIPPFYPKPSLLVQPPSPDSGDLDKRWAGLRAHNRWLADFCSRAAGRRAGVAQIMLHDIEAAVAEIRWAKEAGLNGGVLLPGAPPGSQLTPLYDPVYEPIWRVCDELQMPLNHHSGSAVPVLGEEPIANVIFLLEVTWWAHRTLWHLVFSGVLERHPGLQLVFTEQGTAWIPETLRTLDFHFDRMGTTSGSQELEWGADIVGALSLRPSEYWARQCHVGSSFLRPSECLLRYDVGIDRIMWGSDYPHLEGCFPYTTEALRATFAGVDATEVQAMLATNAATLYGFDVHALAPVAARIGPRVEEVARPLEEIPTNAERCPAFAEMATRA